MKEFRNRILYRQIVLRSYFLLFLDNSIIPMSLYTHKKKRKTYFVVVVVVVLLLLLNETSRTYDQFGQIRIEHKVICLF